MPVPKNPADDRGDEAARGRRQVRCREQARAGNTRPYEAPCYPAAVLEAFARTTTFQEDQQNRASGQPDTILNEYIHLCFAPLFELVHHGEQALKDLENPRAGRDN